MGYLADVQRIRTYTRALEAVEREKFVDGELLFPAPAWAHELVNSVQLQILADLAEDDG